MITNSGTEWVQARLELGELAPILQEQSSGAVSPATTAQSNSSKKRPVLSAAQGVSVLRPYEMCEDEFIRYRFEKESQA